MTATCNDDVNWITAVKRQHTPLFLSFLIAGQAQDRIELQTGLSFRFENIRRHGPALQYDSGEIATARQEIGRRSAHDGLGFFDEFSRRCLRSCDVLTTAVRVTADSYASEPSTEESVYTLLKSYFGHVIDHATFLQTMILTQFALEDYLATYTLAHLREGADRDAQWVAAALKLALEPTHEVQNGVGLLELGRHVQQTIPVFRTWVDANPADLIARIAYDHPTIWEKIEGYVERFGWMGRMYYVGSPLTSAGTIVRLQNILRQDCAIRLQRGAEKREAQLAQRDEAVSLLDGDEAQFLATIVSRYMHLRSYRLDVFFMSHEWATELFEDAARVMGLNESEDAAFLDWQEIADGFLIEGRHSELRRLALDRRDGFEFRAQGGHTEWTIVRELREADSSDKPGDTELTALHGVTAWGGHIQGKVRTVVTAEDMLAMEPGEVLVTTMTMPNLMLAIEKASAIVTDEGGMLCHAAIVSREFDIPCVIGTGDATHRLRTGDTVDVDADSGIVRVIR